MFFGTKAKTYFASAPDVARDTALKAIAVPKRNAFMSFPPR
jgi:hypothetical protein